MQKEWIELTDRWKRHLIRECVRQASISRNSGSELAPYEDFHHGLLAERVPHTSGEWIVKSPNRKRWHARVSRSGKITISRL